MPNIKSSIRSVKTDAERRAKNAAKKSGVRTAAKKVEAKIAEGNKAEAEVTLKNASSLLDKAAQDGVISKNAAARKKSKLAKKVNKIQDLFLTKISCLLRRQVFLLPVLKKAPILISPSTLFAWRCPRETSIGAFIPLL